MDHSARIRWFEVAYQALRSSLLPEAPPRVALTIGWPSVKKSGGALAVGDCVYEALVDHQAGFGGNILITLHPIEGDDLVKQLATLAHEMCHASLEPGTRHTKPFQALAGRIGLLKPWAATTADQPLENALRGIRLDLERELGYVPTGYYVPPVSKEKIKSPSAPTHYLCACAAPRKLQLRPKQLESGPIICGTCQSPFRRAAVDRD